MKARVYLKEWRIHAGLLQRDLAAALGLTPVQLSRLDNHVRDVKLKHLVPLAKAVGAEHFTDLFYPPGQHPSAPRGPLKYVPAYGPRQPIGRLYRMMQVRVERMLRDA